MASHYPNMTTEGCEHLRNDSMNFSVYDNTNTTSSVLLGNWDMIHFIMFTVVGGPMCILGFIANVNCYYIIKTEGEKKHRAATFLLKALAVADNLVLTFSFFNLAIVYGLLPMLGAREKIISEVIDVYTDVYVVPFVYMAQPASVWITVLIAINRYIAVCWPFDAHRLASLKRTKIQVAVLVTLVIIFGMPLFFRYTIVYPKDCDSMMVPSLYNTKIGPDTVFGMVYNVVFDNIGVMILPLILLIFFNTKIIWELRKVDKWKDATRQNGSRSENNITMVMVVIVIVFIVCNIPYPIYVVAVYSIPGADSSSSWYALWCVSQVLLIANSSTNFVVYYVLRKSFRRAFCNTLCCCQPQASVYEHGLGSTATTTV